MVNPEKRACHNRLNITDKELPWLDGTAQIKHTALTHPFGDSRLGSTHMMRLRELLINNMEWDQFWFLNAQEVVRDHQWQPVWEWLKDHPYALLVGDVELARKGKRRERIADKDSILKNEAQKNEPVKDWIGPHRYNSEATLLSQRDRAELEGINCQIAVHVVVEALGIQLDREERSGELFENYTRFDPTTEDLVVGDIVFFYEREAIQDARSLHVAICMGHDMIGVPLLLHATNQPIKSRPAAEVIPISQLLTNRQRYCFGVVRLSTRE